MQVISLNTLNEVINNLKKKEKTIIKSFHGKLEHKIKFKYLRTCKISGNNYR